MNGPRPYSRRRALQILCGTSSPQPHKDSLADSSADGSKGAAGQTQEDERGSNSSLHCFSLLMSVNGVDESLRSVRLLSGNRGHGFLWLLGGCAG